MIMSTTLRPVSGKVQAGMNLGLPSLAVRSMTTMIFFHPGNEVHRPSNADAAFG